MSELQGNKDFDKVKYSYYYKFNNKENNQWSL
jgi:hypothetical protein